MQYNPASDWSGLMPYTNEHFTAVLHDQCIKAYCIMFLLYKNCMYATEKFVKTTINSP